MRKAINVIVLVMAIFVIVAGATFAWFGWNSSNDTETGVGFTVGGLGTCIEPTTEFLHSPDLVPTTDRSLGYVVTVNLVENCAAYDFLYATFTLTPRMLPDELKNASFKYEFVKVVNLANVNIQGGTGDFSSAAVDTPITLATDQVVSGKYRLFLWIDGNVTDSSGFTPSNMQNQHYLLDLHADVSSGTSGA